MRFGSLLRVPACVLLVLFFLTASILANAQDPDNDQRFGRKDDPAAREQWFRRGRQGRNGQAAAKLLYKAYVAKMQMRAAREQKFHGLAIAHQPIDKSLAASVGVWNNLGPRPIVDSLTAPNGYGPLAGRVTALAVDQTDSTGNTVLAAGAYGGVWRSTNAAASDPTTVQWTPLIDDQATLSVGSLALQPGNSNLILVGTGEPNYAGDSYYGVGLLRSTDGGSTWTTISTSSEGYSLFGSGVSQIAFSTKNTNVVAAATSYADVYIVNSLPGNAAAGVFVSSDAGNSWTLAPFTNDNTNFFWASASAVVYNPKEDKFYAVVPFEGVYVSQGTSAAGFTSFVRLANQPGGGVLSLTACPVNQTGNCPLLRGAMSVRPVKSASDPDQMYIWFVADGNGDSKDDQGIWQSSTNSSGTVTWSKISDTGIQNCGDSYGCGTTQSFYNLYISAVPNGSNTDLYAGTINIFKCSLSSSNPTCATTPFQNLTHVYGCTTISMVHPDQHALDFLQSNPNIVYFGDDGGVNRSLKAETNLQTGTCPSGNTQANAFDNLNSHIGPLSQFMWGTNHPTDPGTLMGGTQDNGTMAISPSLPAGGDAGWWEVNGGDGGYDWIDPVTPTNWYSAYTGVSVQYCTSTINCNTDTFDALILEDSSSGAHQADGDSSNFYTPYILDPAKPTQIILGTCRVWRGPNVSSGWPNNSIANAISHQLGSSSDATCGGNSDPIQALAAGGPSNANGSSVIYAGTSGGHVYMTANANQGIATWNDVTSTIDPNGYPVSAVAIDPHDPTGMTAYAGIQGFNGGSFGHVWMTTNGGAAWTDITDGMPDVPVNDIAVDPDHANAIFVASDTGVFSISGGAAVEVGPMPGAGAGYLPNVAVLHVAMYENGSDKRLRAFTHGRGAWETALPIPALTFAPASLVLSANVNSSSTANLTITNHTAAAITLGTPSFTSGGSIFSVASSGTTCGASLASAANCVIKVQFSPTSGGDFSGTLGLSTGSGNTPTLQVQLEGYANAVANDFSFDFGSNATSQTVAAGGSATYNFNLDGSPSGSTTFNPAVTLACSGLPSKATCSFSSSSVSAPGGVTMTIQTTAPSSASALHISMDTHRHGGALALLAVPGLGLLILPLFTSGARRKRIALYAASFFVLTLVLAMGACGGGSTTSTQPTQVPGTPSGTYTVTITGTYGSTTHTQAVTLVVQ